MVMIAGCCATPCMVNAYIASRGLFFHGFMTDQRDNRENIASSLRSQGHCGPWAGNWVSSMGCSDGGSEGSYEMTISPRFRMAYFITMVFMLNSPTT